MSIYAHLSALLDLLPALAQPGQIHLALAAHVVLLKFWDAHSSHIICLGNHPDLGLLHRNRRKGTTIAAYNMPSALTAPRLPQTSLAQHHQRAYLSQALGACFCLQGVLTDIM